MTFTSFKLSVDGHRKIAWAILTLLMLLRIPYTLFVIYARPIENQNGSVMYEVGTYFLIAFLIWWERDHLEDFHLDSSALFFILLLRPLQTLILAYWKVETPLVFPGLPSLMIWGIALALTLALWSSALKPTRFSFLTCTWLAIGLFAGLCVSVAKNFGAFLSIIGSAHSLPSAQALTSMNLNLFYHLGFAPINEEPLFRGFLWGYLRQLKWKEGWILLFQAVLFTSAHAYFARGNPLMFWVLIPGAALLLGWLTLRSRSISAAILAHGMINGSAYLLIAVLTPYLLGA